MTKPTADETTYLWENIPRALWSRARSKAMAERRHMKDIMLELLAGWVNGAPSNDATPTTGAETPDNPRQRGDDDGVEYADPRDERAERARR